MPSPRGHHLIPVLFFVSGATALVYEVIWQRQFALLFGSSSSATATVLASYFAGLGLGSYWGGRFALGARSPLRVYAVLEGAIAIGACLVPIGLVGIDVLYPHLFARFSSSPTLFLALRGALAFSLILIPTVGMGATLPVLGQWLDHHRHQLGVTAGRLYVYNTLGAALGALSVPFLLLRIWGLETTALLCAVANALLAIVAWILGKPSSGAAVTVPRPSPVVSTPPPPKRSPSAADTPRVGGTLLAFFSGFVTFALQVQWNRVFAQVHENSLNSFAIITALVILSLALGAQFARWSIGHGCDPLRLLARAWLGAGLLISISPWLFWHFTGGLNFLVDSGTGWSSWSPLFFVAAAVLVVPMAGLGVALPSLMELAGRDVSVKAAVVLSRILSFNVLGSVLGALVAGFLLPSSLGLWGSFLWLGGIVLLVAWHTSCPSISAATGPTRLAIGTTFIFVFILQLPIPTPPKLHLAGDRAEALLALSEGTHGLAAVTEQENSRRLKLNNHYALGGTAAIGDERMQAHVPMLLHPNPRRVAFLGVGTGISAGGVLFHQPEHLTVVELVPEVLQLARGYFRDANRGLLDDPRTRVVVDDARQFLRGSGETFDVIIGDLVVPWRSGEGALFTREHFEAARAALRPKGLYCQWVPLFQVSREQFEAILETFRATFPHTQLWRGDFSPHEPALALIGRVEQAPFDGSAILSRASSMEVDPTNPQLQVSTLPLLSFVADLPSTSQRLGSYQLNSENFPFVELHGSISPQDALVGEAWLERAHELISTSVPSSNQDATRFVSAQAAGQALAELTLAMDRQDSARFKKAQERLQGLLPPDAFSFLFR